MRTPRLLAPLAALILAAPLASPLAAASTEMALTSSDGFALKGTLTLPAAKPKAKVPVVILAHQFHSDRAGWAPLTEKLLARGIGVLALDLRGHGESAMKDGTETRVSPDFMASAKAVGFDKIPSDLAQAAAWLRKQPGVDGRRIGLAGSSVGAFAVLLAAPEVKPLAVLSLSPGGNAAFGDSARDRLKGAVLRSRPSILVLASMEDKDAAENAQVVKNLPGVAVDLKEGKDHGFAYFKDCSDLMAVYFGEYLTYHHTGKKYAAVSAPARAEAAAPASPEGMTGGPAAQEKKADAPK
ncbi:alpha/beta hydrolase [Geothrix paludis]|uniref:alpha/beta hydrolase n=1 Tax=Geothrix paludis TaxID=2922722 RepID=UPI001FAD156B|nr:alpha/beta fold hydrolase [Geothrix paludis]